MSTSYDLRLLIDPKDVEQLSAAGERIILAKSVNHDGGPVVVWLVLDPLEATDVSIPSPAALPTTIYIWLQAQTGGAPIAASASPSDPVSAVQFGDGVTAATVAYNPATQTFA